MLEVESFTNCQIFPECIFQPPFARMINPPIFISGATNQNLYSVWFVLSIFSFKIYLVDLTFWSLGSPIQLQQWWDVSDYFDFSSDRKIDGNMARWYENRKSSTLLLVSENSFAENGPGDGDVDN